MSQPGSLCQPMGFKCLDLVSMTQGQVDIVKATQQAVFAKSFDIKRKCFAVGFGDDLSLQVNAELVAGEGRNFIQQLLDHSLAQDDGKQSVFEAVVEKDVSVAWRNQRPKAILIKRPGCVFTRRATAKIFACQQDGGTLIARLIEYKVWIRSAAVGVLAGKPGVQVTPCVKEILAEPGFADGLEELLGDD